MSGGSVTLPVIDVTRAAVKGDGLQRAAVDCPTTFRVNTKASGEADLDVIVTGDNNRLTLILRIYVTAPSWTASTVKLVRPLSTVGYTSVVASVIHSRQWSN